MILQTRLYFLFALTKVAVWVQVKRLVCPLPNAQVKGGLAISGGSVENSENEVTQWLKDNGVI